MESLSFEGDTLADEAAATTRALLPASCAKELQMHERLGKGGFGEVRRAVFQPTNQTCAVKKMCKAFVRKAGMENQIWRERTILASVSHPNIVELLFHFEDAGTIYLGMELLNGGDVFAQMEARGGTLSAETSARYIRDVFEALQYLHQLPQPVIYRDLKPENLLVDGHGRVKLVDFGWACQLEGPGDLRRTICGTMDYAAPEMFLRRGYNQAVDMWSAGVLLYEFLLGSSPFVGPTPRVTERNILRGVVSCPTGLKATTRGLLRGLLTKCPQTRITAEKALEHPFVACQQQRTSEDCPPHSRL